MLSLRMKCFVSQKVKPDLPAHSDIKIEDGDTDVHKEVPFRLLSSTLQLFRRIKGKSRTNVLLFYIL